MTHAEAHIDISYGGIGRDDYDYYMDGLNSRPRKVNRLYYHKPLNHTGWIDGVNESLNIVHTTFTDDGREKAFLIEAIDRSTRKSKGRFWVPASLTRKRYIGNIQRSPDQWKVHESFHRTYIKTNK